jgi:NADPH-dependent 7-cyano-7-deazaguanine reductase QueF
MFPKKPKKKAMAAKLLSPYFSSCCNKTKQKEGDGSYRPFLLSKKTQRKKAMAAKLPSPCFSSCCNKTK